MKKVISISLALVFVLLAFAGCSKNTGKEQLSSQAVEENSEKEKEDFLSQAEEVTAEDVYNDSTNNIVSAKEKYCNKVLLLEGFIWEIEEDHIVLGTSFGSTYEISVYLPTEEMVNLERYQQIIVVGKTTDEIVEVPKSESNYSFHYYQMPTAYLVQDRFEYTGKIHFVAGGSYDGASFIVYVGNDNNSDYKNYAPIFFADDVDTGSLTTDQTIKFEAKCVIRDDINIPHYSYKDAVIL